MHAGVCPAKELHRSNASKREPASISRLPSSQSAPSTVVGCSQLVRVNHLGKKMKLRTSVGNVRAREIIQP